LARIDGHWVRKGDPADRAGVISDGKLTLADSDSALELAALGDDEFVLQEGEFIYHAKLANGELTWNDGREDDVWIRDPNLVSESQDEGMCTVCMEVPSDSAVVPCGHLCGCYSCLRGVEVSARPKCPVCRGSISLVVRIYRT